MKKIGVVIGGGTGKELANIFTQTFDKIAQKFQVPIDVIHCNYEFTTYKEVRHLDHVRVRKIVREELKLLEEFYKEFYTGGGRVIFRTAINAETLYEFRRRHLAVKIIPILTKNGRVLIIRDAMQGFYANDEYKVKDDLIVFRGSYRKENFEKIITFALGEARKFLLSPFEIWAVYKHHLFGGVIEKWVHDILPDAKVYQPNHATELLWSFFRGRKEFNILLIMGNEVSDILHEELIFALKLGTRHTLFSKNVYLSPSLKDLKEYQTVHGSADDIKGKNLVNPIATLRIVAAITEHELGIRGFCSFMEKAIQYAYDGFLKGRKLLTSEIVTRVHQFLEEKGGENLLKLAIAGSKGESRG